VYTEAIIENMDVADICDVLAQFTLENCKLVLLVNELFDASKCKVTLSDPISEVKTDKWFGTKFKIYNRPS